ncbi:hypothetical protein AUC43_15215 [Hymenobacter sedentarius]|uniref:Uncharacterized protein n=1 Tax=Hymenobacter sedentarius TaxID=1411621 RepID=A0A0U4C7Q5_9BACT|nr:hypothetical protein [Hymenobacter sedentarius]ALW86312.1 hypothetical protein AUC43_15215 [Hymenobacter sedentarius]
MNNHKYDQLAVPMIQIEHDKDYECINPEAWALFDVITFHHRGPKGMTQHHSVLYDTYIVPTGLLVHVNPDTKRVVAQVWSEATQQFLELEMTATQYLEYLKPDDSGWADIVNTVLSAGEPFVAPSF